MRVRNFGKGCFCSLLAVLPVYSVHAADVAADGLSRAAEFQQHRERMLASVTTGNTVGRRTEGIASRAAGSPSVLRASAISTTANDQEYPTYQVLDLGTLGGESAVGIDINDAGQVTGHSETAEGYVHVFLYEDGLMSDLTARVVEGISLAAAINARGEVTGYLPTITAFVYREGETVDLGSFTGGNSYGKAINDRGQIAGISLDPPPDDFSHGFLYTPGQGFLDLRFSGDVSSDARAINNIGDVAGSYTDAAGTHAYLYRRGTRIDLVPWNTDSRVDGRNSLNARGNVAGAYFVDGIVHGFLYRKGLATDIGGDRAQPAALNDRDEVAGLSVWPSGAHAFLYSRGELHDLGTLGGDFSTGAVINNRGDVAGSSVTAAGRTHAFVYRNDQMIDVGPPGTTFATVEAINRWGQVTGTYEAPNDYGPPNAHGFIATPVSHLFRQLILETSRLDRGAYLTWTAAMADYFYVTRDLKASCRLFTQFDSQVRALKSRGSSEAVKNKVLGRSAAIEEVLSCK